MGTIIIMHVTKKLRTPNKHPKMLVCYDFHFEIFDFYFEWNWISHMSRREEWSYISTLCFNPMSHRPPSPTYPNRLLIKLLQLVIPRRKRKSSLIGLFLESKKRSNYFGYWQPFLLLEQKLNPQEMFVIFFIS
jgi:hypothetical protein